MSIFELSAGSIALLTLPAFINLWAIWHAAKHTFPGEKEQLFWILAGVFLPVAGGLAYLVFGLRRAEKKALQKESAASPQEKVLK